MDLKKRLRIDLKKRLAESLDTKQKEMDEDFLINSKHRKINIFK